MSQDHVITVVVGMTGSGKSCKTEALVRDHSRVLFFDTLGDDYRDGVIFDDVSSLLLFWRDHYQGPFRMIYRPGDPQADFPLICQLVYQCGNMAFVVEEADMFCSAGRCRDEAFTILIGKGRHKNIDMVCVTQAPKRIADFLRSQAHDWLIFMVKEPPHVDYLRDRCSGLIAEGDIVSLPRFYYLYYTDDGPDGAPRVVRCLDNLTTGGTTEFPLHDGDESEADFAEHDVVG